MNTTVMRSETIISQLLQSDISYKNFAMASTAEMLDPSTAAPNVTEYGAQHLRIVKVVEGLAEVELPLLGVKLNVPLGWGSKGGFDTMERVDFFPALTHEDLKNAYVSGTSYNVGIKVLNASEIASDFKGVQTYITEKIYEDQKIEVVADEPHHAILIKIVEINNPRLTKPSFNYTLYIQDPSPNSSVWVAIDIRAPRDEMQKYIALLGLIYRDIQIDWAGLRSYMQ